MTRAGTVLLFAVLFATGSNALAADRPELELRLGTLWFLSAQQIEAGDSSDTDFLVKRGHLDFFLDLGPHATVRVTPDITVDGDGNADAPVKYAYLRLSRSRAGPLRNAFLDLGRVPTAWIGFAESVNRYRLQDGTFMDRLGFFSSADEGIAVGGLFGEGLPERFVDEVRPGFAGRWGSFALGITTGSGFKAGDRNDEPVFQGRLSLRLMPDSAPGLQLSALVVRGDGNTAAAPEWSVNALMASWQGRRLVAAIQAEENRGVQSGAWTAADGRALPGRGWSVFTEVRRGPGAGWASFVRHDRFDRDRSRPGGRLERTIVGAARHFDGGNAVLLDWEHQNREGLPEVDRLQLSVQLRLTPRTLKKYRSS